LSHQDLVRRSVAALATAVLFAAPATSQDVAPHLRPGDLLVSDNGTDVLYRLSDLDLDGGFNGAGEINAFFTSGSGGLTLTLMSGVAVGPDGAVFVCDTSADVVARLVDLNGDGDAEDAGEQTVFFGGTGTPTPNLSGVAAPSMLGIAAGPDGALYIANSGVGSTLTDTVIRLFDGDGDGDAQDAGEAAVFFASSTHHGGGSLPTSVAVAFDGVVYYGDSANSTAPNARGVWRLQDGNGDGDADDAGEFSMYFQPAGATAATLTSFYGLGFDELARLFVTDHSADVTYAVTDFDGDLAIGVGESAVFYNIGAPSMAWSLAVGKDLYGATRVFLGEDQTPERVHALSDLDLDGDANDAGEATLAYSDVLASIDFMGPRAMAFMKGPSIRFNGLPAGLGTTIQMTTSAGAGELFAAFLSVGPLSIPLPPFGLLGANPTPGLFAELLPLFVMPATGSATFGIFVPNLPWLLGVTYYVQGVGGPAARLLLTNTTVVTFQ
jgi:hypothetical protein